MKESDKLTSKDCKGCYTISFSDASCEQINPKGICPCTNCLVKPVCARGCEEFSEYITNIRYMDLNNKDREELGRKLYES